MSATFLETCVDLAWAQWVAFGGDVVSVARLKQVLKLFDPEHVQRFDALATIDTKQGLLRSVGDAEVSARGPDPLATLQQVFAPLLVA